MNLSDRQEYGDGWPMALTQLEGLAEPHFSDLRRLLTVSPADATRVTVVMEDLAAAGDRAVHSHNHWELFVRYARSSYTAREFYIVPPGVRHEPQGASAVKGMTSFNFSLGTLYCAAFPTVYKEVRQFRMLRPILMHLAMLRECRMELGEQAQPCLDAHAFALARELAALYVEMLQAGSDFYAKGRTTPSSYVINMAENLWEPLASLSGMAAAMGLNPGSMSRIFRRETGVSAKRYQIARRLRSACDLLAEGEMTISEVAGASGWNNPHYFSTVFRRFLGMTPREYQRRNRGKSAHFPDGIDKLFR